ncbi:MAG: metallophosphoesterase [Janthinobacterium lividum]
MFIRTGLAATIGAALLDSVWFERYFIELNEFHIGTATPHTANIRIVQISDLHLTSLTYQLTRLAKRINRLQPDLILLTGDAIDAAGNIALLDSYLKLLDKKIKKVAILGNWEYWGNVDLSKLRQVYAANNCDLLVNQTRQYSLRHKTVSITGIDDYVGGKADFSAATADYQPSDYHLILTHCPQYSEAIASQINKDTAVDFVLSGHTHGGQVNVLGFVPFLPPGSGNYLKGWYRINSLKLYVSKGIGTSILPLRFGARAEIALFNLLA